MYDDDDDDAVARGGGSKERCNFFGNGLITEVRILPTLVR